MKHNHSDELVSRFQENRIEKLRSRKLLPVAGASLFVRVALFDNGFISSKEGHNTLVQGRRNHTVLQYWLDELVKSLLSISDAHDIHQHCSMNKTEQDLLIDFRDPSHVDRACETRARQQHIFRHCQAGDE